MRGIRGQRPTPLTWAMIALSAGLFLLMMNIEDPAVKAKLWIADPRQIQISVVEFLGLHIPWLSLPWNEPWRFLTPIFVHGGVLHVLFNMLWLQGLGSVVERRHGSLHLTAFVIVCGALSNVAQYEIGQSPAFVGMSGVVYGLLGMVWLRGRLDPLVGYAINPATVQFMLLWLVLGFAVPSLHSANWCHLGGLAVGCAWGALAALGRRGA